jgi:hypothetical protein
MIQLNFNNKLVIRQKGMRSYIIELSCRYDVFTVVTKSLSNGTEHCDEKPYKLAACFIIVSGLAYSSTLKIEATFSSEKSLDFQRTTRRYIQKREICITIGLGILNSTFNCHSFSEIKGSF